MNDRLNRLKSKFDSRSARVAGIATAAIAAATPAFAVGTVDFTGIGTAVTAEITPAVTAALPIAGAILGIGVALKLYKRFAK